MNPKAELGVRLIPVNYIDHNAERKVTSLISARHRSAASLPQTAECFQTGDPRSIRPFIVETSESTVCCNGENVRLSIQAVAHRRQRSRQDMSAVQIQRGLLQYHLHIHNRWVACSRPYKDRSDIVHAHINRTELFIALHQRLLIYSRSKGDGLIIFFIILFRKRVFKWVVTA